MARVPNPRLRKQVPDLTLEDLKSIPVWKFALNEECVEGQNEETVKPWRLKGRADPRDGLQVVSASFILAAGSRMEGFLSPPIRELRGQIGYIHPTIVTPRGQVNFWNGAFMPSRKRLERDYWILGKTAAELFPLTYRSQFPIVGGPITGTIPGFLCYKSLDDQTIVVLT